MAVTSARIVAIPDPLKTNGFSAISVDPFDERGAGTVKSSLEGSLCRQADVFWDEFVTNNASASRFVRHIRT